VYEHRKEGDVFLIRDPNVALDQVEEVQQEVIALLENQARAAEESLVEPIEESTPRGELDEPQVPSEEALEESTQADGPLG
jgi:hypothetical protein